jgi:hypothetical protein
MEKRFKEDGEPDQEDGLENEEDDQFVFLSDESSSSGYQDPEPDSEETWIEWFCKRKGNEFICEVDKDFFDIDNISDLKPKFSHFEDVLNIVIDFEPLQEDCDVAKTCREEAEKLY